MNLTPDERPIRLNHYPPLGVAPTPKPEPTASFPTCPECGRCKSKCLTLEEAYRAFGYASTDCPFCQLTNIGRGVLAR